MSAGEMIERSSLSALPAALSTVESRIDRAGQRRRSVRCEVCRPEGRFTLDAGAALALCRACFSKKLSRYAQRPRRARHRLDRA